MGDEEPVGYLGGEAADDPYGGVADEDPYGAAAAEEVEGYLGGAPGEEDPYGAEEDPYGAAPAAEEVEGYLGGDAGEEDAYADSADGSASEQPEEVEGYLGGAEAEAPALPGQAGADEPEYSHRDFMDSDVATEEPPVEDPYAAPVEEYETQDDYQDPYALPGEVEQPYDEYEGYDAAAMAQGDDSYFDSMGHTDELDAGIATRPVGGEDYGEDYEDDDGPKTISQQDAESIIRRITTKRILPPESDTEPLAPPRMTQSGGGLRIWPILVVLLLLGAGTVVVFREPIARKYPQLAGILGVPPEEKAKEEVVVTIDPQVVLRREMLQTVLKSELRAFGATEEDMRSTQPIEATDDAAGQGGN